MLDSMLKFYQDIVAGKFDSDSDSDFNEKLKIRRVRDTRHTVPEDKVFKYSKIEGDDEFFDFEDIDGYKCNAAGRRQYSDLVDTWRECDEFFFIRTGRSAWNALDD